jgi:protein-disulfide isomerase-like protein with CxxC motif
VTTPAPSGPAVTVDFWFDPTCPWAWMTSRWLTEIQHSRDLPVRWHLMSRAVLNEHRDVSPRYAEELSRSWAPLRVIAAARAAHGEWVVKPLYDAIGTLLHPCGQDDLLEACRKALADVGLPPELADAAEDATLDGDVRASHAEAVALVGDDVGTPVIAIDGVGFFGPVVTPAPTGEAAERLWDALVLATSVPGFYELKRSRTRGPVFD